MQNVSVFSFSIFVFRIAHVSRFKAFEEKSSKYKYPPRFMINHFNLKVKVSRDNGDSFDAHWATVCSWTNSKLCLLKGASLRCPSEMVTCGNSNWKVVLSAIAMRVGVWSRNTPSNQIDKYNYYFPRSLFRGTGEMRSRDLSSSQFIFDFFFVGLEIVTRKNLMFSGERYK